MPFVAAGSPPELPAPPVQLRYFTVREARAQAGSAPTGATVPAINGPLWQLTHPFRYRRDADGAYFDVPAHTGDVAVFGNHADLATVPGFLWGVLGP